jgi:hypothetical protein
VIEDFKISKAVNGNSETTAYAQVPDGYAARLYNVLRAQGYDFTAKYLAVCSLHSLAKNTSPATDPDMISALESVLKDHTLSRQTQCLFLYKEAASALGSIVVNTIEGPLADGAISALKNVLGVTRGNGQRAAAEALGSLPVSIHGPRIKEETAQDVPCVEWHEVLKKEGVSVSKPPTFIGRSLVAPIKKQRALLVFKLASVEDSLEPIHREATWMQHLCSGAYSFPVRFNVPVAIKTDGSHVFRLRNLPVSNFVGLNTHPMKYAIGFIAHRDYFAYPNEHRVKRGLTAQQFREVMFRNAWLLGQLTSLGIVHRAPIPLFHNRVQSDRRLDNGMYEWWRGGRLDRWLYSCCYPNFGVTGIRDFEHFIVFKGPNLELYRHVGSHILSLFLVTASYFRNKDTQRVGRNGRGEPVDARDLFDKTFFQDLISGIFLRYYSGFVGQEFSGKMPVDFHGLALRMIEEMGADRHMEEVFRVVDQEHLTDHEFRDFLRNRGCSHKEIAAHRKGKKDIFIYTGPHLGGFNERISLPELIEALSSFSALCMAGRYWKEREATWQKRSGLQENNS